MKKFLTPLAAFCTLGLALFFASAPAHAEEGQVYVWNKCYVPIRILVRHKPENAENWRNAGWYTFSPGEGANLRGVFHDDAYQLFYYAEGTRSNHEWSATDLSTWFEGTRYHMRSTGPDVDSDGDVTITLTCR